MGTRLLEGTFRTSVEDVQNYVQRGDAFVDELRQQGPGTMKATVEGIYSNLVKEKANCFEDCVRWARLTFEELFSSGIKQLLCAFPKDMRDSNGNLFWSGRNGRLLRLSSMCKMRCIWSLLLRRLRFDV